MDAINAYSSQQIWTTEEIGYRETARLMEKNSLAVQNGEMPAFNVILSEESLHQAAAHNAKVFAKQLDGTAADGTSVSVQRTAGIYSSTPGVQDSYISTDALEGYIYSADFTDSAGNSVNVEFTGDIKSAMSPGGNRSVYFYDTNTTRTYGADGNYSEAEGDLIAADADSIFISTSGGTLSTGNGNNLVFVYGDNADIRGGSGNDDIRLASGVSNARIDTGSGNDTVTGTNGYDLDISLNEGNNTVSMTTMTGGSVTAGDGNNNVNISTASGAAISLGDGQNTYVGGYMKNDANLTIGDGDNIVDVRQVGAEESYRSVSSSAAISLGNGDNNVKIYGVHSGSQVAAANGNNTINIYEADSGSAVSLGNGNNNIVVYRVLEETGVTVGNGNNNVNIYQIENGSKVSLGNGTNRAQIYQVEDNSYLGFGNGNNAVQLYGLHDSVLHMGDGDNDTSIYKTSGNSKVQTGDGNNLLQVDNMENESQVLAGEGENAFYIGKYSSGTSITDSLGNAFDEATISGLREQGLWNSLSNLKKVRSQREKQGEATTSGFANDAFFNAESVFSTRNPVHAPSKADVEALKSYTKAAVQNSVKLTRDFLPESISRYMNDPGVVESMNYFWSGTSSSEN